MDDVTEMEKGLRQALRHVPAPEGFTSRVMARVAAREALHAEPNAAQRARGTLLRMHPAAAWWSAVAAALLLTAGGGDALHLHNLHRAQRQQAAQAQVDRALRLTGHALDEVELNVDRGPAGRWTHLGNESLQ